MTSGGPGQVLFHFVRHWARRPVTADAGGEQGRLVLACEALYEIFAQLTAGWSGKKRRDFQQAMTDLLDRSYAMGA
ncbi:hypothetical protein [Amycolatopsis sp. NPDC052450]|uniref:hypothetical protein n=1 Tax=Amycolatopsis sp. NPDC052450 TaxID=3363937 RepID=UPI0037C97F7C